MAPTVPLRGTDGPLSPEFGFRLCLVLPVLAALLAHKIHALETNREYGASSFKFLKLPLSPRIVALGGAGAALADEAGDLDLNPASPASDSGQLIVGKGYPFGQFQGGSNHISWSIPYGPYRVLVNARYLGFDKLAGRDELARLTTPYGAQTIKGQAGLAGGFRALTWGATVNYAQNTIAEANYGTAMVNAGLRYLFGEGLHAGVSIINADFWGSESQDAAFENPFPPTALQAGLSYAHDLGPKVRAAVALDARTRNDEKLCWPMGAEVGWNRMIYLRVGYPVAEQEPALSAGVGLHLYLFRFNYAYQGHENLEPGHFWSLEINY